MHRLSKRDLLILMAVLWQAQCNLTNLGRLIAPDLVGFYTNERLKYLRWAIQILSDLCPDPPARAILEEKVTSHRAKFYPMGIVMFVRGQRNKKREFISVPYHFLCFAAACLRDLETLLPSTAAPESIDWPYVSDLRNNTFQALAIFEIQAGNLPEVSTVYKVEFMGQDPADAHYTLDEIATNKFADRTRKPGL